MTNCFYDFTNDFIFRALIKIINRNIKLCVFFFFIRSREPTNVNVTYFNSHSIINKRFQIFNGFYVL